MPELNRWLTIIIESLSFNDHLLCLLFGITESHWFCTLWNALDIDGYQKPTVQHRWKLWILAIRIFWDHVYMYVPLDQGWKKMQISQEVYISNNFPIYLILCISLWKVIISLQMVKFPGKELSRFPTFSSPALIHFICSVLNWQILWGS